MVSRQDGAREKSLNRHSIKKTLEIDSRMRGERREKEKGRRERWEKGKETFRGWRKMRQKDGRKRKRHLEK